jgi:uncharacterized protein
VPSVGALLDRPAGSPRAWLLLAHGAGASMQSDFLTALAHGIAGRDIAVLRFEYPYMRRSAEEGRRRPPDRAPALLAAHRAALGQLRRLAGAAPLFLAGKSLGGRMASHLAAEAHPISGCALLGFPLHPAGRPERAAERCAHFPRIHVPTLFLQGTRDPLAPLAALRGYLATLGHAHCLRVIEGADHDFKLPRGGPHPPGGVTELLAAEVAAWISASP